LISLLLYFLTLLVQSEPLLELYLYLIYHGSDDYSGIFANYVPFKATCGVVILLLKGQPPFAVQPKLSVSIQCSALNNTIIDSKADFTVSDDSNLEECMLFGDCEPFSLYPNLLSLFSPSQVGTQPKSNIASQPLSSNPGTGLSRLQNDEACSNLAGL
jgi:hypothetical protein